jgi:antibiotic biosynthesis monooxygenase (ABM) superfamily enzyme
MSLFFYLPDETTDIQLFLLSTTRSGLTAVLPGKCDWFCKSITSKVSCELLISVQVNNSLLLVTIIAQLLLTMPCMVHTFHINLCHGTYMHVQLVTYLLTPCCSVLLEKLTVLS